MSWLVRMHIDAAHARREGMVDGYAWHQRLWDCFPGRDGESRSFLSRIDETSEGFRVWLLAPTLPVKPGWCPADHYAHKELAQTFLTHHSYAFDLRANPTICRPGERTDGRSSRGKRVPLRREEELRAWIVRKGIAGGFEVDLRHGLEVTPPVPRYFKKHGITHEHSSVEFRGMLRVTDHDLFRRTYHEGIGSAKAFGFGMLLLAPIL